MLCSLGVLLVISGANAEPLSGFTIQLVTTFDYSVTGVSTQPQKINDKGDVVGVFVDSALAQRGFIRFANGRFSAPLIDPNDDSNVTQARGINNSRAVCGFYLSSIDALFHGFFFSQNAYTNYDVPGASGTDVLGINNVGDFCGAASVSSVQSGFLSVGGTVTVFTVSGATQTLGYQLNSSNQVAGEYLDSAAVGHGFYRNSDGSIVAPIDPAGSTMTIIFGNNDSNLMVGRYVDAGGATHGFLFVPPNRYVFYDYPGATFTSLNGINNKKLITGRYQDSAGLGHGLILQIVKGTANDVLSQPASIVNPAPNFRSDEPPL